MSLGFSSERFLRLTLPEDIFCKICKCVMNNPVRCLNCKFFICLNCTQSACGQFPADKHIYSEIDIKLRNKIKELDIKCRFHKQGCLKIDKVDNIEQHEATCTYAKLVCEHSKHCFSELHSQNCPHTLMMCPTCKKQMKFEEKKTHNCIGFLLEYIKQKESQNQLLTLENEKLLQDQNEAKRRHAEFVIQTSNEIQQEDVENQDLITKVQLLNSRIKEKRSLLERAVQNKFMEYNEYCEKKFDTCNDKNQEELSRFERSINKSLNNYLDLSGKRLFEFNAAVQADCIDLSTVPIDMKEYDQNPLKKVVFIPSGNPNMKSIH